MTQEIVSDERLEWLAKYYSSPSNSGFDHEVVFALRELVALRAQMREARELLVRSYEITQGDEVGDLTDAFLSRRGAG